MASVTFDAVSKRYGEVTAVDDLNLAIDDGEFMVLLGPSGCGKTTALRMIAGLEDISDGKLSIGDEVVNDVDPSRRDISMVFQSYALYPHMTVQRNIESPLLVRSYQVDGPDQPARKLTKAERDERVAEAARVLDLEPYLKRKPAALSGGQRQRVALARAFVGRPKVFLMDEPLSNLDAKLRVQTRTQIASLQRRLGVTTVYVTHDQTEALTMGDRIAVLKDGVLQQVGTPRDLYEAPQNVFVAGFIGSPAMNLFDADVVEGGLKFGTAVAKVERATLGETKAKKVTIGIRPEDVKVAKTGEGLPVDVDLVEELGADGYLYGHTEVDGNRVDIVARVDGRSHPNAGDKVFITPEPNHIHVFDTESGLRLSKKAVAAK